MALKTHPIRLPVGLPQDQWAQDEEQEHVPKFRKVSESQVASHQPTSPPNTMLPNEQQS